MINNKEVKCMPALLDHEKLREEMRKQSLKQEPLAESIGISDRYLRTLCSKDTNVSTSILYKISQALNVPIDKLVIVWKEEE